MNWAKPIVMFDLPKDSQAVAFFFIKFQGMPWELGLQGLSRDDETKYHDVQWNWALNYTSSITNNSLKWESDAEWNEGLNQIKVVLRKIIYSNTILGNRLRSFPKVLLGNSKVEEVLFDRKK